MKTEDSKSKNYLIQRIKMGNAAIILSPLPADENLELIVSVFLFFTFNDSFLQRLLVIDPQFVKQ